jgi:hypothetical protein
MMRAMTMSEGHIWIIPRVPDHAFDDKTPVSVGVEVIELGYPKKLFVCQGLFRTGRFIAIAAVAVDEKSAISAIIGKCREHFNLIADWNDPDDVALCKWVMVNTREIYNDVAWIESDE